MTHLVGNTVDTADPSPESTAASPSQETTATSQVIELTCDEEGPLGIDYDDDEFPVVSNVRSSSWADRWQQRTNTSLVGAELLSIQGQPLAGATIQVASAPLR
jgi:hypothetical protein